MPTAAEIYMAKEALAQQHAVQQAHSPVSNQQPLTQQDRLMQVGLENDINRLSSIQSHQKRNQLKADELLGRYSDYLQSLIDEDSPRTENIISWNMIWAIDAADIPWAMVLAEFAIKHDIETPEGFRRDIRNTFAGDISRFALLEQKQGNTSTVYMIDVLALSDEWDIIDEIRADVYKASGFEYEQQSQTENALKYYQKALDMNPRAGVQRAINRLKKQLEASKNEESTQA